ncbi:uncharacterized protein PFL1_05997 [Pseudozyma flocculosa PF-1]|uniref:DUF7719 domain-containing protein n=2 Tax=Pseudozyma flocculosa TaxID=84751 RepID=A0A5C3F3I2_9BASI|nr:uncharacterized protein PFL1_05997 [Pseudozyma flocculosa PF-1]EPQ26349.1 hypothetical protein PFL1_05997 [Pseudozyma flocculosa PF-1]SPO39064.1 uncharacterized protein PSFLO_04543 [Pseudozyma flocculosa]
MGKITEIVSEDVSNVPHAGGSAGTGAAADDDDEAEMLTSAQREQVLFQTGVLDKLGLPKDYITLQEAQKQLEDLKKRPSDVKTGSGSGSSSGGKSTSQPRQRAPPRPRQAGGPAAEWTASTDDDDDDDDDEDYDSQDDYGQPSDAEYASDDDAEKLMRDQEARGMSPALESALDLVIWTMPFGFVYTLLDILVRQQYAETVGFFDQMARLVGSLPLLALFIWYNLTSKRKVLLQVLLFLIFTICTPALIYIVNKSPYDVVMRRVPPLGTLCIFAAVRLELLPTCIGLAIVAGYVQYYGMKIVFD